MAIKNIKPEQINIKSKSIKKRVIIEFELLINKALGLNRNYITTNDIPFQLFVKSKDGKKNTRFLSYEGRILKNYCEENGIEITRCGLENIEFDLNSNLISKMTTCYIIPDSYFVAKHNNNN